MTYNVFGGMLNLTQQLLSFVSLVIRTVNIYCVLLVVMMHTNSAVNVQAI